MHLSAACERGSLLHFTGVVYFTGERGGLLHFTMQVKCRCSPSGLVLVVNISTV
jgi:hypothetical protein